jgi:hypothetical protein
VERIFLVSCVKTKTKKPGEHRAKDLYTSKRFILSRKYVEQKIEHGGGRWFILSAEHKLLHPDKEIKSYNTDLKDFSKTEKQEWSSEVIKQLHNILNPSDEVEFIAPKYYCEFLIDEVRKMCSNVHLPWKMADGKWLNRYKRTPWLEERIDRHAQA